MSSDAEPTCLTQVALDQESLPRFSHDELGDYFAHVKLPQQHLDSPVLKDPSAARTKKHGLPFVHALALYHMCNVTFDNLVLHYSPNKTITLDQTALYNKIVRQHRGGRCMEQNSFLATVLRSVGFEVRNCAGRVARAMSPYTQVRRNQAQTYDGWNHMLNLVRLDDEWYVVDVGMGAMGPNLVFPLQDGFEATSVAPRRIRLQHRSIAESFATGTGNSAGAPKMWCYDVCYNPVPEAAAEPTVQNDWVPVYCFTETEFLPQDYEVMSWFTSTHPRSFFTRYLTVTRMLIADDSREEIVGNLTLFKDAVRKTIGNNREVVKECKTEDERIQVLASVLGVQLSQEERDGMPADRRLA